MVRCWCASAFFLFFVFIFYGCTWKGFVETADYSISSVETENGTNFKVIGSGFREGLTVYVGDFPCDISSQSETEIECEVSASVDSSAWSDVRVVEQVGSNQKTVNANNPLPIGAKVFGRPDFKTNTISYKSSLNLPIGAQYRFGKFIVADSGNSRILVWNGAISSAIDEPDYVIGQSDFNTIGINRGSGSGTSRTGLNAPQSACYDGTRLFISDTGNHRILVYNSVDWANIHLQEPDFVLGQQDFVTNTSNYGAPTTSSTTAGSLRSPGIIDCDSTHLLVPDSLNHRVLIWHGAITQNFQSATAVFGQRTFTENTIFASQPIASADYRNVVGQPWGVTLVDNGNVIISNFNTVKNQVLDHIPLPGEDLMAVTSLGSTNWGYNGGCDPTRSGQAAQSGNKLYFISERQQRVYYYDLTNYANTVANLPLASGCTRTNVVSSPTTEGGGTTVDFVSGLNQLNFPRGLVIADNKMYVIDQHNDRILVWDTLPTSAATTANWQYGQPNNKSAWGNGNLQLSPAILPNSVQMVGDNLYVLDRQHRLVKYDNTPSMFFNGLPSVVFGQQDSIERSRNGGVSTTAVQTGLYLSDTSKISYHSASNRFFITDSGNHRVLVFSTPPTSNSALPSLVIGQSTFTTGTASHAADKLFGPTSVCQTGNRIFVADTSNHRVVSYNNVSSNGAVADLVLGQAAFGLNAENAGGGTTSATATSMRLPGGVFCGDDFLIVTDSGNNRVLIWNSLPLINNQAPDVVVGQATFTDRVSGLNASRMNSPRISRMISGKLYVVDGDNNRILVWNSRPTTNGQPADHVIGQNDFVSKLANMGASTPSMISLSRPFDVNEYDAVRIVISDQNNRRTLVLPKK